jgi:hypothetical protein
VVEEYCRAIKQAAWRSCCGRSGSTVWEFKFQLDSLILYTYTTDDRVFTQLRLTKNSNCTIPSGTQILRKTGSVAAGNISN